MKKNLFALLCAICILVSGCGSIDYDAGANGGQSSDTFSDNANKVKKVASSDEKTETNKEMFYGDWKITSVTGQGYIFSANYDEKDYIGKHISFSEDTFCIDGVVILEKPIYKKNTISEEDLFAESKISKKNLGYKKGDKVIEVSTYNEKKELHSFGSKFYIKDDEHLIFIGPMYFLAERVK